MEKNCSTCSQQFTTTPEEIAFIDKVSPTFEGKKYAVPAPEFCSDCRLAQRTVQRNEQYFHHAKSAVSGMPLISLYSPDSEFSKKYKIFSHEEWWSENWDPMSFGQDYDFSRPFFEQFHELNVKIPRVNLIQLNNENSVYTTGTGYCKNCYLINCSENCEDCCYGKLIQGCKDVIDSSYAYDSELLYQCFSLTKCYNCVYLSYSQNSIDCFFSENLKGCKNCFLCTNLDNKQYYFLNQPLTKDEYNAKIKEFFGNPQSVARAVEFLKDVRTKRIFKYANVLNCEASTGDFLTNCKNCTDCYDTNDSQDCKYVTVGVNVKDVYDCSNMYLKPELNYQVLGTIGTYNVIFSIYIFNSQNVMYSQFCFNSQNLFGCAGLRNKKYCIFNKQYTKEEYEKLVPKIIEQMEKNGEWGGFFPTSTSPFGYNESVAQEYLPLTKEQALAKGFYWQEPDARDYKPQTYAVPENIRDVPESIINEVLACASCGKNYKIIAPELKRLKVLQLPVPLLCPDCRHGERMALRNPRKLWPRNCKKCGASIQSTFAPDRPETIYCESCYLKAVF